MESPPAFGSAAAARTRTTTALPGCPQGARGSGRPGLLSGRTANAESRRPCAALPFSFAWVWCKVIPTLHAARTAQQHLPSTGAAIITGKANCT
eukprot:840201-Prymnesium_polylepis.1